MPSVLYVLARHGLHPEEAIVRAVNHTCRDNDTIGAIVGAAVGALHGYSRLPERWIRGLLGVPAPTTMDRYSGSSKRRAGAGGGRPSTGAR